MLKSSTAVLQHPRKSYSVRLKISGAGYNTSLPSSLTVALGPRRCAVSAFQSARHSVGCQYSSVELPEAGGPELAELEAYYTHHFSEFHRLRFVANTIESDLDPDALRFAVQYTAFLGSHQYGLNW